MTGLNRRTVVVAGAGALVSRVSAQAPPYPSRPITIVVPNTPGSPYEPPLRLVNPELEKRLGQSVVIEYKPGAGGLIGANHVSTAKPDGYTLLYGSVQGIHPLFVKNRPVDAAKQLSPISAYAFTPFILFSSARFKTLQDAIAFSKANPNQLKWGYTSAVSRLNVALIQSKTGLTGDLIPYQSAAQINTALIAGELDLGTGSTTAAAGLIESGRLNAVLVASTRRTPMVPNTPSAGELGYSDLTALGFTQGLWGPPGLPKEIAQKLSSEIARVLKIPENIQTLRASTGADILGTTPEEQLLRFESEIKVLSETAKTLNFQPQ